MLDEVEKQWLALIETKNQELIQGRERLALEAKRNNRLKAGTTRTASNALLEQLEAQNAANKAFVDAETTLFFKQVFGVEIYQPVAVKRRDGIVGKALLATQFIARQLSNGLGVFTVTGDSIATDLHKGLPECEYLMAQEQNNDWVVAVT